MSKPMNIRIPLPFVIVACVAFLVGGLTRIELPCPISGGTGILTAAKGLKIESVDLKLIRVNDVLGVGCDRTEDARYFTYAVDMLLTNGGVEPSSGIVLVDFYDTSQRVEGTEVTPLLTLDAYVTVPAETTKYMVPVVLTFERYLQGLGAETHMATVRMGGNIICPISGGKGKLPFAKWAVARFKWQ